MTDAGYKSEFVFTTDTPYLALRGELLGVYFENLGENWPCYNGTALYLFQMDSECQFAGTSVHGLPSMKANSNSFNLNKVW